jgi:hypothetical protein
MTGVPSWHTEAEEVETVIQHDFLLGFAAEKSIPQWVCLGAAEAHTLRLTLRVPV